MTGEWRAKEVGAGVSYADPSRLIKKTRFWMGIYAVIPFLDAQRMPKRRGFYWALCRLGGVRETTAYARIATNARILAKIFIVDANDGSPGDMHAYDYL